ncbi:phosphoketolase [Bordetella genomosp. 9]|uniref:phosphoketolase family protein n=1 Tax=Bordetella genomosp. 9 TaxID=1416803 RepID=UPI000A295F91|nr:phosphoketolase family protein [Bordetella genomosp. 9]ARP89723.1 phosphoketolase [Bordetella genomosp. 9]
MDEAAQPAEHRQPLTDEELQGLHAYWRASNYLAAGMIYLRANPLLREPLKPEHIKRRLLGHWGSSPGQTFALAHLNRLIRQRGLNVIYISGPGHGAPATLAHAYLDGGYSDIYPDRSQDEAGMQRFFRMFSSPGGIGSHCTPETPGSIHEGGELGYSLAHGYGAVFDNPDLIAAVMVGDGEAETGPLATAWHSNKFLDPIRDGAVLPILHLNGYKIANPTILARIPREELTSLLAGYGHRPHFVEGDDPQMMHRQMAAAMDRCIDEIHAIQRRARQDGDTSRPRWPMIVLRSPKGWTGPEKVGGHRVAGFWRSHQVPIPDPATNPESLRELEAWLRGYRPEDLFDEAGAPTQALRDLAPRGERRISANPHANGGLLCKALNMPDFRDYAVPVQQPAAGYISPTEVLGRFLRDVIRRNPTNFRLFGPDETASNRLTAVYEASGKTWMAQTLPEDQDGGHLARDGRVMEMLSEHTLEGWFEGYVLTGRHGLFASYEAFVHVIDSMFNQHAKWLEKAKLELAWRAPIPSINLLITSLVWRQDHNGFTHQDPGFLDVVCNKSPEVVRVYLPPDANCLLSVADHCLRTRDYVNVIVADKQPHLQYLDRDAAIRHCTKGIGIWEWASTDEGAEPDLVMACAGDVATMEALAAVEILRHKFRGLKIRFVNVVDLFRLMPDTAHPHGLSDRDFDSLFTADRPVIFNFHAYPALVHRLTYRRRNHANFHVHGYRERGNINTPFELAILNQIDRFHLAISAIDWIPALRDRGAHAKEWLRDQIITHLDHAHAEGIDREDIRDWVWSG